MHELSIAQALLRAVERIDRGAAPAITAIHLRVGAMTCVDPESLSFAFGVVSRDSPAAGCQLVFERVAVVGRCRQCGWEGEPQPDQNGCQTCGAAGLELRGGRELELVAIEVAEPERS